METSVMIRQLRYTAKKHENDTLHTFDTNISAMCTDVANRLEELEKEKAEIRAEAIEEFYDKALNFEDYIEPLGTSSDGVFMYSGADITRMVVNIRKELMKGE